jgi:hypothetical protein
MTVVHCDLHNTNIVIYPIDEWRYFIDDNRREIAIFVDAQGNKSLKRFVNGECDESCEVVKELLG